MAISPRFRAARKELAKRVRRDKASARAHGTLPKMRRKYLAMLAENCGFNAKYGIGRCPKYRAI